MTDPLQLEKSFAPFAEDSKLKLLKSIFKTRKSLSVFSGVISNGVKEKLNIRGAVVGQKAPDVELVSLPDFNKKLQHPASNFNELLLNNEKIKLSQLFEATTNPILLNFGSYSWNCFREKVLALNAIQEEFKDQIEIITIYIQEMHAIDGWKFYANDDEGICFKQPTNTDERINIAKEFVNNFEYKIPLLVDPIENLCDQAYNASPDRLFIVINGILAFKSGMGPFGYLPNEVRNWFRDFFLKEKEKNN